jgi:hypothetical protein
MYYEIGGMFHNFQDYDLDSETRFLKELNKIKNTLFDKSYFFKNNKNLLIKQNVDYKNCIQN